MSDPLKYLDISLLGGEYRVACPPGQEDALRAAVSFLEEKMRTIARKSRNATPERVAVMAALNIANDYLSLEKVETDLDSAAIKGRIDDMGARIDAVLAPLEANQ